MIIGQNVFKNIAASERKEVFAGVVGSGIQLLVRIHGAESFHVVPREVNLDQELFCHFADDAGGISGVLPAVVNFDFDHERYFFKTHVKIVADGLWLNANVELFQLQRRANVRIPIPKNFDANFSLHGHGGKKYFKDCTVKDVSAGGVRIEFTGERPDLQIGDSVRGTLRLGTRRAMEFDLEVRFVQRKEVDGQIYYTAGTRFQNMDKLLETRLLTLMTDLQRELFVKRGE